MRISRTVREELNLGESHGGAAPICSKSCFDGRHLETPWAFIHVAILPPGSGIGHHTHIHAEEVFVTINNAAQFTHNGRTAEVVGGAAVPVRSGESHAIYNHTDKDTWFFNFHCTDPTRESICQDFDDDRASAPLESTDRLPIGRFDRSLLISDTLHMGKGKVLFREVWSTRDFTTNFEYLNHIILPPDTSIGFHRHDTVEEAYVIMDGHGFVSVDHETTEVGMGDVIPNWMGGSHGIYNHTDKDLEMFVIGVSKVKGEMDATDLGDDLSERRP